MSRTLAGLLVRPGTTRSTPGVSPEVPAPRADDRERLIALVAAPLAAAIAVVVCSALGSADPAARLAGGAPNPRHVAPSIYGELLVVLLAISVVVLGAGLARRRLPVGIGLSLYGLAVFNLHYWGFGVPFVIAGAWFLVRAYRSSHRPAGTEAAAPPAHPVGATKRYTPPNRKG